MKICLITRLFPVRSQTFVQEHATALARRGWQVTVISSGPGEGIEASEIEKLKRRGVNLRYAKALSAAKTVNVIFWLLWLCRKPFIGRKLFNPKSINIYKELRNLRFSSLLQAESFDFVHVHFGDIAAGLVKVCNLKRLIVTWHGYDVNVYPRKWGSDCFRTLMKSPSLHTVNSEFLRERLISLGADPLKIIKVPMGIDIHRFKFEQRKLYPSEPIRILSVGRLVDNKGHANLLQALAKVRQMRVPAELTIIGSGPLEIDLMRIANELLIERFVEFKGSCSTNVIIREMKRAHIFALTGVVGSDGSVETQGVVFLEAQACGLPVIASRIGGVGETVQNGKSGWLCAAGDIHEISSRIAWFYENPCQIEKFGRFGRKWVEKRFSQLKIIKQFESLYRLLDEQ